MAWDDEMPTILRVTIQDTGATPLYTDDSLAQMILVASLSLQAEIAFLQKYVPNLPNGSLKPDPTLAANRDDPFINLCCVKAALLLVMGEIKSFARQGIRIRDGSSEIQLQRDPAGLKLLYDAYKAQYDDALYAYKTGGVEGLGEIITSPYPYLAGRHLGAGSMYEGYAGLYGYRSGGCESY